MKLIRGGLVAAAWLLVSGPALALDVDWREKVDQPLLEELLTLTRTEFMVQLDARADLSPAAAIDDKAEKGRFVVNALQQVAVDSQAELRALLDARGVDYRAFWIANSIAVTGTFTDIEAIARLSSVTHIHWLQPLKAPAPVTAATRKTAPHKAVEAGVALVRAPEVWADGFTGQGIVVGDHDIGVEWTHPALQEKYRGWDPQTRTASHDYNWRNAFGATDLFCPDTGVPCDSNGHGTHTTGTMVGDDGNGMQIGMAPGAQWIGCRSLLDPVVGLGTVPTYMDCMEWMIAPYPIDDPAGADPAMAPDVVNNSWGCLEGCAPPVLDAVNQATKAAGIVQVVSAGNDGDVCSTIAFPLAVYEESFTVGATDVEDAMASFSSRGPVLTDLSMRVKPNVVAPGVSTVSAYLDGEYASLSGTSMSGPHVAGLVALLLSSEPRLIGRVDDVRSIIENTAVPILHGETCGGTTDADIPNNTSGFGRIDAYEAVSRRPVLELETSAGASGGSLTYTATISLPADAAIPATGVVLGVALPDGATVTQAESDVTEPVGKVTKATEQYMLEALAPGGQWTVTLTIDGAGSSPIASSVEADQVSPKAGDPVSGSGGSTAPTGSSGAWGLGGLLLLLALAGGRRR